MTKTYEINVPSGKYAIDQSDDHIACIYTAFEHFCDNVITPDDNRYLANLEYPDNDVFELITITIIE